MCDWAVHLFSFFVLFCNSHCLLHFNHPFIIITVVTSLYTMSVIFIEFIMEQFRNLPEPPMYIVLSNYNVLYIHSTNILMFVLKIRELTTKRKYLTCPPSSALHAIRQLNVLRSAREITACSQQVTFCNHTAELVTCFFCHDLSPNFFLRGVRIILQ